MMDRTDAGAGRQLGVKEDPNPKLVSLGKVSGDQEAGTEEAGTLEGSGHGCLPRGQTQSCSKM